MLCSFDAGREPGYFINTIERPTWGFFLTEAILSEMSFGSGGFVLRTNFPPEIMQVIIQYYNNLIMYIFHHLPKA